MTSISPHAGQPTRSMLAPSAQNAGQSPAPCGTRARASIRPCTNSSAPFVISRADVYPRAVRRAVITRLPRPSSAAFSVPAV
jgi:hypothetical protein